MSASDKKQQRKAALTDGLTQKQLKERADAQAAKKRNTVYAVIGVVCAVAAVALLVWSNMDTWQERSHKNAVAATVNGVDYNVADLQYYYGGVRSLYYQYASYGIVSYDPSTDDGAQWYNEAEGTTYADFFRESALTNLEQTAAMCAAAQAEGYTLSAEGQQSIDSQLSQIDVTCARYGLTRSAFFAQQYGSGVTEKVFLRNLTNDVLADEYSAHHLEGLTYDEASLQAYYQEHPDTLDSYDYRTFFISGAAVDPTDSDGNPLKDADGNAIVATDEEKAAAMAAAKEKADEAVETILAAEDPETAFIAIAPNYVAESMQDSYASAEYSLSKGVMGNTLSSNGSAYASWIMDSSRKAGDVTAVESTNSGSGNGYFVVLFLDRYLDQTNSVNIRHILIKADTTDSTETDDNGNPVPTQAALDAAKVEAQSLMDQWKAGDQTAESFGALAEEHSDDPGSKDNGGRYAYVNQGDMFEGFDQWIFDSARKPGDVDLVENPQSGQQGWHVIYFEGTDGYWEDVATKAKQNTEQTEWREGIYDSVESVAMDGMNYVGSVNTAVPTTPAPTESPAA